MAIIKRPITRVGKDMEENAHTAGGTINSCKICRAYRKFILMTAIPISHIPYEEILLCYVQIRYMIELLKKYR